MSCSLKLEHPKLHGVYDAHNVYFKLRYAKLDSSFVHVSENGSVAFLEYPGVKFDEHDKFVRCYVDTGPRDDDHILVDSQRIFVGCE